MPERLTRVPGVGGVALSVRTFDAPPGAPGLVLLHGLASSSHIWDLMLPGLVRRFRVVAYDARGHGLSAKPTTGYGFDRVAGDAVAVMRATRLRRPFVVGHSWGAMVALHLAATQPRTTGGVVLVDGGLGNLHEDMTWEQVRERLAPPRLAGMPLEEFRRRIPSFFGDAVRVTSEVERIVLAVMRVDREGRIHPRLNRANHLRILREIWKQDHVERHRQLAVPALAILAHGAGDRAWDEAKRATAARLRAMGAPTTVSWVEGIHDLPLQHPRRLNDRIRRFVARVVG